MREMTHWRDLKKNFYEEINERYNECKLKNLNKMNENEYDDWRELMSDERW